MLGFVFPGQGSQHSGMGKDFFENFKSAQFVYEEASDAIHFDLKKLCFEGSDEDLKLTENTQPALLTTSYAIYKCMEEVGVKKPNALAGHSLGEFSALAVGGALNFSDAVKAVRLRGKLMQKAVPVGVGGMAALMRLDDSKVHDLIKEVSKELHSISGTHTLEAANYNAPGQIVLSGTIGGLKKAEEILKNNPNFKGGRLLNLPVSAPFHSSLMEPVKTELLNFINTIEVKMPKIPYIPNVTAEKFMASSENAPSCIRNLLADQVVKPVKWTDSVSFMANDGINTIMEVGPKEVLSALAKRIAPNIITYNINTVEALKQVSEMSEFKN